ncbi:hypothetical protein SLA2020_116330 [Shorea laevis]
MVFPSTTPANKSLAEGNPPYIKSRCFVLWMRSNVNPETHFKDVSLHASPVASALSNLGDLRARMQGVTSPPTLYGPLQNHRLRLIHPQPPIHPSFGLGSIARSRSTDPDEDFVIPSLPSWIESQTGKVMRALPKWQNVILTLIKFVKSSGKSTHRMIKLLKR